MKVTKAKFVMQYNQAATYLFLQYIDDKPSFFYYVTSLFLYSSAKSVWSKLLKSQSSPVNE